MIKSSLELLEKEVWRYVETLKDSPEARLGSRKTFYKKYGRESKLFTFGFGDAEIAFLKWEERSVLHPPHAVPSGSEWWSSVNLWFIYLSELGAKAFESGLQKDLLPAPAQAWIDFIVNPSSSTWYRAHNSSIIDGYLKYPEIADKESLPEKVFINMVLYRLLFAQSMVEGDFLFAKLGKILGDPRGEAVKFITGFDAFYPKHYPMTQKEIKMVMGTTHNLGELGVQFMDDVLIEPELSHLYKLASEWNNQPALNGLIKNHRPSYPYGENLPNPKKGLAIRIMEWLRNIFFKNKNVSLS
ncbi:hypothetical protein [Shivajiella indica]|uniref:Uncharacterized protein n=1 Tax=Shivajiella indica TaxID=872115 RepID=A0ABW5B362_9BACT